MMEIVIGKNQLPFLSQFSPLQYQVSLLQPKKRALVDESGMTRTQMESTVDQ
jgi:hypothetical protein